MSRFFYYAYKGTLSVDRLYDKWDEWDRKVTDLFPEYPDSIDCPVLENALATTEQLHDAEVREDMAVHREYFYYLWLRLAEEAGLWQTKS